jgi:arsenite methyltransferase
MMLIATLLVPLALAAGGVHGATADSTGLPSDSATFRIPFSGVGRDLAAWEQDRSVWQLPEQVVDSLEILPGQRIADLGAGSGYFEWLLAKAVGDSGNVFAQEIQPALVQYMQDRAAREGTPQVHAVLGTTEESGLPDSLDLIFVCDTYRYIDGRRTYFARLRDHLRRGGRLAIVEFKRFPADTTERRILPARVMAELNYAGYELEREYTFLPKQFFFIFGVRTELKDEER